MAGIPGLTEGEVMELPGDVYLFNLSLIAVTFAVVSALVMIMRQTMGGRLSNFDVYLITTYISIGFVLSVIAILPPLVSLFHPTPAILWGVSGILAAVFFTAVIAGVIHWRWKAAPDPISWAVKTSFSLHILAIIVLVVNAIAGQWQGVHLYAAALTLSLANVMWAFVRRIASLLGDKPGEDWDPKRG